MRLQSMSNRSRWEGGHRANIQAQVSFPGQPELRQEFARQEDRAVVNRTSNFLRHTEEDGASVDRFITIMPLDRLPSHEHRGGNCQVVLISCSSEALNELKRDPLLHDEPGPNTSSTTFNNSNEVRVE